MRYVWCQRLAFVFVSALKANEFFCEYLSLVERFFAKKFLPMNCAWRVLNITTQNYGRFFSLKSTTILEKGIMNLNPGKPTESSIMSKLIEHLKPEHLEVINESFMHNVPKGSETHFKVVVVSKKFESVSLIKRHRIINELLRDELAEGVHALSIVAKSPTQWESSDKRVNPSPACRGGFGK